MANQTPPVANFEYVFYFLLRTYLWRDDGTRWDEPLTLGFDTAKQTVTQQGIRFEGDKRLFRRDVAANVPLAQWGEKLKLKWRELHQIYAEEFGDLAAGEAFCQQALLGVALVILDDGDSVKHHRVTVACHDKTMPQLQFVQSAEDYLFSIGAQGSQQRAQLHNFIPVTPAHRWYSNHLQLCLGQPDDTTLPYLAPLTAGELATNPGFSVYGLSYGGHEPGWQTAVEKLLIRPGPSQRPPLLSTVFARLIVRQWQFGRLDEAAKILRPHLQSSNTFYNEYTHQNHGTRPICAKTPTLETHLQEMQVLNNEALFLISRLQDGLQTLLINSENLTQRLEEIRQYEAQGNWQLCFYTQNRAEPIHWPPNHDEVPLLKRFELDIKKLTDHKVYLENQILYLTGLQQRWRLYLQTRQNRASEYLNVLGTVVIFLLAGNGVVTLNLYKSILGLSFEEPVIYLSLIGIILLPLFWYGIKGLAKLICCITYSTWFYRTICQSIKSKFSIEFYHWFKQRQDK